MDIDECGNKLLIKCLYRSSLRNELLLLVTVMQIAVILVFIDLLVLLYKLQSILSLSAPAAVWTCSSFEYSRTAMHMGAFFWGLGTG